VGRLEELEGLAVTLQVTRPVRRPQSVWQLAFA